MTTDFDPERISELKAIGTHTLIRFAPDGLHRELFLSLRDEFDRQYYFHLLSSDNYTPSKVASINIRVEELAKGIMNCEYAGHFEPDGNDNSSKDQASGGKGNPE